MYWGYRISNPEKPDEVVLPVFGPPGEEGTGHFISDFSFTDQTGKEITQNDFKDKYYVTDFFFVRCEGICPIMTNQMKRVYDKFKSDDRIRFLSHTVKPEQDSVSVLAEYAREHGADPSIWHFVTGDKKSLYQMARKSYLVTVSEGDGSQEDLVHTQFFALVDPQRRIRGYYDGTDSLEVDKLIHDLGVVLK
ncbi:MAG: SCO family protein [Bacteroidia bacterium]|nr:SCO family protein [Bacteroidia bacterium]